MAATAPRTLRLLSLLQQRRQWAGADLAGRLGVSVRTLRRDVDRLRELGYPVEAARGVDGGYALTPGAALPPLVLDDDEAVALALGLQAAAAGAVGGMAESSVRALAKVVHVMPVRLRRRVEALRAVTEPAGWARPDGAVVDPAVLTDLATACRDGERVRFGYTAADGRRAERWVEPYRLVPVGRRWYLVGYDLDRGDRRTFRLDRAAGVAGTGSRSGPRRLPFPDAAAFVRARLGRWATVEAVDPGSCRVHMDADALEWPAMALGSTGAAFTVLGPPEFAAHLRALAERYAAAVAGSSTRP